MTPEESEELRQAWRTRFAKLVEEITGPLDAALERAQVGLSRAERIKDKAQDIESAQAWTQLHAEAGPAPKREDPLWALRKRKRGP